MTNFDFGKGCVGGERPRLGNQLLGSLPAADFEQLRPHLELVTTAPGQILAQAGCPADHAWFIESGLVALMIGQANSPAAGGFVGNDGMIGLSLVLEQDSLAHTAEVLIGGSAYRISRVALVCELNRIKSLRGALLGYTHSMILQWAMLMESMANSSIPARLATMLLILHDRTHGDLPFRHVDLARLLGTRRASITDALHVLEGENAIRSTRSSTVVLSRDVLEEIAGRRYSRHSHAALTRGGSVSQRQDKQVPASALTDSASPAYPSFAL